MRRCSRASRCPRADRVAIVTNAGGPGILAADACEANGLQVAALAPETTEKLRAFLPPSASVANPVDMIASASAGDYRRAVEIVLSDPNVDSLLTIFIPPIVTAAQDVAEAIRSASAGCRKPVLATFMGAPGGLTMAPIPTYIFPESAAVALALVTRYGEWLQKPHDEPPRLDSFNRDEARRIVARVLDAGGGWMEPVDAQALLDACGVPVARARTAQTADGAVEAAGDLGYPVVVKALGAELLHKTDVGGVKLGLRDARAVRDAFTSLHTSLGERLEGVLVQRMLPAGVEMVVGGLNDPALGPVIMGGTGGVLVELFADTVFRMCPLTETDAQEMVDQMKGRALLRGYRGSIPADEAAFRRVLLAVSQLLDACPEIQEMDVNPIIVAADAATAVDVRIRVGIPAAPSPQARRISDQPICKGLAGLAKVGLRPRNFPRSRAKYHPTRRASVLSAPLLRVMFAPLFSALPGTRIALVQSGSSAIFYDDDNASDRHARSPATRPSGIPRDAGTPAHRATGTTTVGSRQHHVRVRSDTARADSLSAPDFRPIVRACHG